VDFKNTVVILTSNVGSAELSVIEEQAGTDDTKTEKMRTVAMTALRSVFRPEFINRLDEIVVYRRLGREQLRRIVDIQLGLLGKRLARRDLGLEVTEAVKDYLGEVGYDPQFGARPLKRAVQRYLEDPLARRVLSGGFMPGQTVVVDYVNEELTFTATEAPSDAQGKVVQARVV
jgi:ATP-dependent Clp protease ATP-binding subunit ClpB